MLHLYLLKNVQRHQTRLILYLTPLHSQKLHSLSIPGLIKALY